MSGARVEGWSRTLAVVACGLALGGIATRVPIANAQAPSPRFVGVVAKALADGRTMMAGGLAFDETSPVHYTWALARFNADGSPDATFGRGGLATTPIFYGYEFAADFAVLADGRVVVGGMAADPVGMLAPDCYPAWCRVYPALARLRPDGSLDPSFNGTGKVVLAIGSYNDSDDVETPGYLHRIEVDADGTIGVVAPDGTRTAKVAADGHVVPRLGADPRLTASEFAPDEIVVVETYNASADHYFITRAPAEIATLDEGIAIRGWRRTGEAFKAFAKPGEGRSAVCRYYLPPGLGDSHFFGRDAAECDAARSRVPGLVVEDERFFYASVPTGGSCPAGTRPLYRLFDNRVDANHRYTTSRTIRDGMVARGWIAEGDGDDRVAMCVPR